MNDPSAPTGLTLSLDDLIKKRKQDDLQQQQKQRKQQQRQPAPRPGRGAGGPDSNANRKRPPPPQQHPQGGGRGRSASGRHVVTVDRRGGKIVDRKAVLPKATGYEQHLQYHEQQQQYDPHPRSRVQVSIARHETFLDLLCPAAQAFLPTNGVPHPYLKCTPLALGP